MIPCVTLPRRRGEPEQQSVHGEAYSASTRGGCALVRDDGEAVTYPAPWRCPSRPPSEDGIRRAVFWGKTAVGNEATFSAGCVPPCAWMASSWGSDENAEGIRRGPASLW